MRPRAVATHAEMAANGLELTAIASVADPARRDLVAPGLADQREGGRRTGRGGGGERGGGLSLGPGGERGRLGVAGVSDVAAERRPEPVPGDHRDERGVQAALGALVRAAELEEEELRLRGDRCGVVVSPRRGHPPEFASRARHEARAVHRARQAEYVAAQGEDDAVLDVVEPEDGTRGGGGGGAGPAGTTNGRSSRRGRPTPPRTPPRRRGGSDRAARRTPSARVRRRPRRAGVRARRARGAPSRVGEPGGRAPRRPGRCEAGGAGEIRRSRGRG